MTGEEDKKIVVAVRRKSDTGAMPNEDDPFKISLKIDINEYYCDPCTEDCGLDPLYDPNAAPEWHSLKKLSLENGDGREVPKYTVLTEGVAVNLNRMASGPEDYGYDNWYGNWVILNVNGVCRGVYVNQEQHDKLFMQNRGLYIHGETWLYKSWSSGGIELKVGDDENPASPAVKLLCYLPFGDTEYSGELYPTPGHRTVALQLPEWINMQGLLAMGAVEAFTADGDAFYTAQGHNAYFLDFNLPDPCETRKRMYFRWDVDSAIGVWDADPCTWDIYENKPGNPTINQEVILGNPVFRAQYNQIFRDLFDVDGPLSEANIHAFLDDVNTPELRAALAADPYSGLPIAGEAGVAAHIDEIKAWISQRIPNVLAQVDMDEPVPPLLPPGIILLEDGFEGAVWDANWNDLPHNWLKDTWPYGSAAWADDVNNGDFTSDALDTSDATATHIDFWFMKDDTDANGAAGGPDFLLYYYDGTNYDFIADLDTLGGDDEWLHYTDTIIDSQYFVPDFKIRFNATPDAKKNENVWVDDVVITKEAPMIICGDILESDLTPIDGVSVDANNAGGSDISDVNGYYELFVPFSWTGTVTPTKEGYTFDPNFRVYDVNVTTDVVDQNYIGTLLTYTISGTVTCEGSPLADVAMSGLLGDPCSDGSGYYTATVDYGWDGTVTPIKEGYSFSPASTTYTDVNDNHTQDYTATLNTYTISGFVGIADVNMVGLGVMSDGSGNYTATVDYGFTATVTPTKAGYTFSPPSRSYSNVAEDHIGDNYTATLNTYTISGAVGTLDGVTMNGLPGNPITSGGGLYSATVDYGWSGTVTPTKNEYKFSPTQRAYSNVTSDQTSQDYTAYSIYDLDSNGSIDYADLRIFTLAWLSATGEGNWNADCDFYTDGFIDFKDFAKFALAWQP